MHGDFEPLEEYNGDIIRIDRLIEFLPTEHWSWDETGEINLNDISIAIHEAIPEIINHPIEIKDIEIDNECSDNFILPQPVIIDGWHRYVAARWLYDQGKLSEIHCRYGGREDLLLYLKGETDEFLEEAI